MNEIKMENAVVHLGSCLDVLPTLPDNSVDAVVTDPPYELGFMGKSWDSSGIAFNPAVWAECLRVLKPGGHLLAFGGSRTWHRIAVAIEDAGFEVRDSIAWLYGSGFPKSLDISKAIDKSTGENRARQLRFTEWMRSTGITSQQINEATGTNMGGHYLTDASQPAIATADLFDKLRPYIPEVPEEIERLVAERTGIEWTAYRNREVIGKKTTNLTPYQNIGGDNISGEIDVTTAATEEARKWSGWGTALKPAFEPVVVARKPLIGTVAANVLQYGTGGLNIDGTRIGTSGATTRNGLGECHHENNAGFRVGHSIEQLNAGRWPANVMLDEFTAELLDEQSDEVSRFFYVAKASKRDRNEGLDDLPERLGGLLSGGNDRRSGDTPQLKPTKNFHPTVKPTDLMRQLIRLVTPPGGTVLDPFTGSGSTGKAAILEGFDFIGIELTDEYLPIIEGRLRYAAELKSEIIV